MAWRVVPFICLIAWGAAVAPALAQQTPPPQEPILRIDPGMHTAPIKRIGVDAACTLLATGSEDKTVRLWRLPEGKLLRTRHRRRCGRLGARRQLGCRRGAEEPRRRLCLHI